MRPHPDHRFHWRACDIAVSAADAEDLNELYDNNLLADIARNKYGSWSAQDVAAANDILAYRLDWPRGR